jgi:hypothetical protein
LSINTSQQQQKLRNSYNYTTQQQATNPLIVGQNSESPSHLFQNHAVLNEYEKRGLFIQINNNSHNTNAQTMNIYEYPGQHSGGNNSAQQQSLNAP